MEHEKVNNTSCAKDRAVFGSDAEQTVARSQLVRREAAEILASGLWIGAVRVEPT